MRNRNTLRIAGTTLFWIAGILMLSACQPPAPPPVPGQPLTWEQKHQMDLQEAQEMHDRRRQDRPCAPHDCRNN